MEAIQNRLSGRIGFSPATSARPTASRLAICPCRATRVTAPARVPSSTNACIRLGISASLAASMPNAEGTGAAVAAAAHGTIQAEAIDLLPQFLGVRITLCQQLVRAPHLYAHQRRF